MPEYGLSLGSNLGRRLHNLQAARRRLAGLPGVRLRACSPVYETEPVDVPAAYRRRRFLNAVILVDAPVAPERMLAALRRIERAMGRPARRPKNAPRTIDLDIIYAGRLRRRSARLKIPHPGWSKRRFVVEPLATLRPDLRIPGHPHTVRQTLLSLPNRPKVTSVSENW